MSKIRYILCGILVVLCSCGVMLSGCGNSIDNLSVKLTGSSLVELGENEYSLTLTKEQSDSDESWTTEVSAEVIGLGDGMSSKIEWSGDSRYVNVVASADGSKATITGVTSTNVPTIVTAYSVENRKAQAIINITNIVKPQAITGSRFGAGELGIPLNTPYSLSVGDLFEFSPQDATLPVYEYVIGGVRVNSDEEFTLSGMQDGYVTLTAVPKNKDEYTAEQLTKLSYTMDRVRVYVPLTNENTLLSLVGQTADVTEITIIKNAKDDKNKAVLQVNSITSLDYSVSSPDNIVYDETDNPKGKLSVKYDEKTRQFTLIGLESMEDYCRVDISFSVKGVKNSVILTKSFSVRIVDYPNSISVNGIAGEGDYELIVYDRYNGSEKGAELRLNISPNSKLFTDIDIEVDTSTAVDMNLVQSLIIDNEVFDGNKKVKNGTKMCLNNEKGYGSFAIMVYAHDTRGTANEISRKIIIRLRQSITDMRVDSSNFDKDSGKLILEIDEYNYGTVANTRELGVSVEPKNASFDTVKVSSANPDIADVSIENYATGTILVRAKSIGATTISLVAQSGVKLDIDVRVVARYRATTISLDPDMSSVMYSQNLTNYRDVSITGGGVEANIVKTLNEAYIAKTGNNNSVYLMNTFYPASAVTSGIIDSVTFSVIEGGDESVATIYNTNSNIYRNALTTNKTGSVTFNMVINYYELEGSSLQLKKDEINGAFSIKVFERITSISVNESSIELLAGTQSFGIGQTSQEMSVYDSENNSKTLRLTVNPMGATITASAAVWTVEGNTSKIILSGNKGMETVVSAKPFAGNDLRVSGTVVVSITDMNGVTYSQEVKVVVNKIQQITDVYIKNYESSLRDESLYFELYKEDSFVLDVSTAPANATNKNLEYIIFDAELLAKREDGEDIIRVSAGSGRYLYYRILPRVSPVDPEAYVTQYSCKTAQLVYDESAGTYTIKPKKAGYAFVFIIPQDVSTEKVDEITKLNNQLRNVTDRSTVKRLSLTVADGESVYYRLYTPEDVASIGSTQDGLSKNYYVMNTIDMSSYINKQLNADSSWEWTPIGSISRPFTGTIQSMVYNGESPTQNIVGWSLNRKLDTLVLGSTVDYRNYGIFGVVSGEIKNLNIYFNNYNMKQSVFARNSDPILNNYNYGLLVGRLTSREVTLDEESVQTVYGKITNVMVYCGNLVYEYTHRSADKNEVVSANLGAVGMADAGTIVDKMTVSIENANIVSNDMIINFGGIIGYNSGILGESDTINKYQNASNVVANLQVKYDTSKTKQSTLGGAVGLNYGVVKNTQTNGKLSAVTEDVEIAVGGVVGKNVLTNDSDSQNSAIINNVLSAVKIRTQANNSIQGGVVGYTSGGKISFAYYDIFDTQSSNNDDNNSIGIIATGFTGGIAGKSIKTDISYVIVQAYDLGSGIYNMISNGGVMGGLVGLAQGGSIECSFVYAGLKGNSGVVAGILGQGRAYTQDGISISVDIHDVYARGFVMVNSAGGAESYAYVGETANSVSIEDAYVDLDNDNLTASKGTITARNIYVVGSATNLTAVIKTITREDLLAKYIGELGLNSSKWKKDSGSVTTNDGYPYLLNGNEPFVRVVPNSLSVSANDFDTVTTEDNKINSVMNIANDTQKLVITYREGMIYKLSELFNLTTDPSINVENVSLNISTNGTNVVQLINSTNFMTTQVKLIGTGTAYIKISSSQNKKAYDVVQICVIDGFDSVGILDGNNESVIQDLGDGKYHRLKIKHNGSTQIFVEYYADGQKVNGVSGGVKFVTGLKYDATAKKLVSVKNDAGEVITNYSISIMNWEAGTFGENDCLYYYASNNDKIVLASVGDDKDSTFVTLIIPYINVQFYNLDVDKNIIGLSSYKYEISGLKEISFDTQIYYGVSGIAMGVGDGTTISSGEKMQSSVTIFNDAYVDTMQLRDMLWYQLYEVDEDDTTNLIAYFDPTLPISDQILSSNDVYVNFTNVTYIASSSAVIIDYTVELSQTMRKTLKNNKIYRIVIGAIDDNGEKITQTVSLQWTFIPQEVTHVSISHFSDAINNGAKLTQAGEIPTNTIVAGEYGLLRITISPDYANFDSVEVTSSEVDGNALYFDQRVLEVVRDGTTGEDVFTYLTWQQGVGNINNGLSLNRASLINGDFDGNLYVRTICLGSLETGTQFTVTVTIVVNGVRHSFDSVPFTVYKTDVLSIAGENYSEALDSYIVAEGTGYVSSSDTWVQNQNPIDVSIGEAYYDAEISVDSVSSSLGASVIRENGKYYLYTGNVSKNNIITVTLTAKQNIGGFTFRATRSITYEVVDFYIKTLRADEVMPTTKRFAFIDGKNYDFNLFDGIDSTNMKQLSVITFDPSNIDTCNKVLNFIKRINGVGIDSYNGWKRRVVEADGRIAFVDMEPKSEADENWIDNHYQFLKTASGYKILSSGISSGNVLRYELLFYYNAGSLTLTNSMSNATFGLSTDYINMEFYQITSQEHPQPIRTLNQLMTMEADIDYILLNDLTINDVWTPLNIAVKSFNGNGYTINFNATSIVTSTDTDKVNNYGLFGTISENSVIKNVRIVIGADSLAINDNEASRPNINFGVLAGVNEGTIYNCQVYGLNNKIASKVIVSEPTVANASHNVAGLVALNSGGITNSRVEYLSVDASGNVAGLVVENSGVISGSYYSGGIITNRAKSESFVTAGLVVNNTYGAIITSSYVGGTYTVTTNGVTKLDERNSVVRTRDATINSGVASAGFVYSNYGEISDCYSAVGIFSTKMSGFAFTNYGSGKISRCYSTSDLSSGGTIIAGYPFIGVNSDNATQNNNYNKTDGIVNCYYYDSGFANTRLEEAKALSEEDFCGTNGNSPFGEYIFSRDGEAGSEFTGVWVFAEEDNIYFTPDRFVSTLQVQADSSIDKLYTNFGPKLVSASLIATPRMELIKSEENSKGEIVHTYVNKYGSVFKLEDNADYLTNYSYDPIIISNMTQFNDAFDTQNDSTEKLDEIILSDIRIINNLTQSDLPNGEVFNSPSAQYAGILSGNGFTFNNISLAINDANIDYYGLIGKLSYVAKSTEDTISHIGTIKNYTATVSNIACSTIPYVGGLVGWVDSGNLYDIKVTNKQGRVVGNNFVGGIAGYVTGTSRVHTAYANVGVTANYRANTENLYNLDLINAYGMDTARKVDVTTLGYAGGLFGVVDITQFEEDNPSSSDVNEARVYNIKNDSNASVVGKIAGGLIGGVGEYTVVYKASKIVETGALIKGYVFAGGIVGQNNGFIKYANINYTSDIQSLVDSANTGRNVTDAYLGLFDASSSPLAIGGVVGLNIGSPNIGWSGGAIQLSSSKIAVRDITAGNAGGIVGASYGGDIRACLATGSVFASKTAYVGGIVGYVSDFSADNAILVGMNNPFGEAMTMGTTMDYLVAMNNYFASDYNYYYALHTNESKGIYGALGGIAGYVHSAPLIYTTHTVATNSTDKYAYLTNPTNYFVSQISNRELGRSQTLPITSGTGYFNLYEEGEDGTAIVNYAIGKYGTDNSINLAIGKTRGYMLNNYDEIFAGWDEYSINNSSGTPSIEEGDSPREIEVRTISDLKKMYWHPEKTYILVEDIDFQDYSVTESKRIKTPFFAIGSESSPFTGEFKGRARADGTLPKIKDVYIINTNVTSVGFFGAINNAHISDIIIQNIHYSTALNENATANVGGLAGVATNSLVENVTILNDDDDECGIFTKANNVGGMFGKVRSLSDGEMIIESCYVDNNLVLTDNVYSATNQTGAYQVTFGGFAGTIEGNVRISGAMSAGKISITYTDTTSQEMKNKNASEIEHIVGGFAGQISGEKVVEDACVSNVDIILNNVLSHTRAGGFAGIISGTNLTKVDSHSNITVNMANITDNKVMYVGGLVGELRSASSVSGFVSAGDIKLLGEYGVDTLNTTAVSHYVAGIVGNMASAGGIASGYSLVSIINDTLFANMDMGFGTGDIANVSKTGSVKADKYYALTLSDSANIAQESSAVKSGGSLDTTGRIFARSKENEYYHIRNNATKNEMFNTVYSDMFAVNSGLYKTAPILISQNDKDTTQFADIKYGEYRYYLQTSDITLTNENKLYGEDTQLSTFHSIYNGGGYQITLPTHFDVNTASVSTLNCGLFGEISSTQSEPSMLLGVVLDNVNVYANLSDTVANFGILAGVANEYTIIANCYVSGEINLNINGATNIGGLVGSSGAVYIGCATDLVANLYGDAGYKYGAIFGVSNTPNVNYTLIDVYSAGKINNSGTNAIVTGMIADSSISNLFARNSYTMVEINSESSNTANIVYSLGTMSHNANGIWYDSGNSVSKSNDALWETYSYRNKRGQTFVGDNYLVDDTVNYGMPVLNWIKKRNLATYTGRGTTSDPYIINTATQFNWIGYEATYGTCYLLNDNIDYRLIHKGGTFAGYLDGNYKYILNSSGYLFNEISGSVTKLGFDKVNVTSNEEILAKVVKTEDAVSQIYVKSNSGKVVGSGQITNSLSTGATFGVDAVDCYTNTANISDADFNNLDSNIWIYNGLGYTLAGFVTDCADLVTFGGQLSISDNQIMTNNEQEFYNALYYASKFAGSNAKFVIMPSGLSTLDLKGNKLNIPDSISLINNIQAIENGCVSAVALSRFGLMLNISNCGIIGVAQKNVSPVTQIMNISNSKFIANREGGMLFDTISSKVTLKLKDSAIFVRANNVDLVAGSVTKPGSQIEITNISVYGESIRDIIRNNRATTTVTIDTVNAIDNAITSIIGMNTATATATITLKNMALSGNVVVTNNGTINLTHQNVTLVDDVVNENTQKITITLSDSYQLTEPVVEVNSGKIIIQGRASSISSKVAKTNTSKGTITINLTSSTITSQIVEDNAGKINITLGSGSSISSEVANSNTGTISVNLTGITITNAIMGTNEGTINLTMSGGEINTTVVNNNAGTINVSLENVIVNASIVNTNNGVINWNKLSGTTINTYLVNDHNGSDMIMTLDSGNTLNSSLIQVVNNGKSLALTINGATIGTSVKNLVVTNNGTVTINVNAELLLTNMTEFAFVGESSGVINLNINAQTQISGTTISGVVGKYSNDNADEKTVNIVLNANYTLAGTTVTPITGVVADGCSFDATKNLNYTQNTYNIIVNDSNYDSNPTPTEPENPDSGEIGGGE